jgi:branched-chain amino acid transport system substrate-binding protein
MAEHVDIARRRFLTVGAGATTTLALTGWPARGVRAQGGAGRALKLGYVSPQTGPLAGFGEADNFVVAGVRKALGKGLVIRDRTHPIEILVRDSQSDPNRAAEVASRLT